ncbi:MarR family transcriptional regulator [Labrenzia suaedae]|uniref:MarR family transcriptional regulator n=2 Tax=Roseibium litorale TaxID=2803841 RepID=A0ABR9CPN0_9HYPH|nr:MarR family transcriptional regulator [Roseibium litorale]
MDKAAAQQADEAERDTSPVLALESFLPYRLNLVSETVSQAFASLYETQFGIARPEWRVIALLGQYGELTAKTIGERSAMHKTKVSRAVAALEKRKLVIRTPNPDDMRESFVDLAPDGLAIYEAIVPQALAFTKALQDSLSAAQREALDDTLDRIMERVKTLRQ